MPRKPALVAAILAFAAQGAHADQPVQPQPPVTFSAADLLAASTTITLTNGPIHMRVAPPGLPHSLYRGTRFDQAGVITSLTLGGHDFYGLWYDRTAPDVRDYVDTPMGVTAGPDSTAMGPVEEFGVIGFAPVPGTLFLKIGVGILRQPDTQAYDQYRHYEIVDGGRRTMHRTKDSVTFIQTVSGAGYDYVYEKTLRLTGTQLVMEHVLKNAGPAAISTDLYDHNFLKLAPRNDGIQVTVPFAAKAEAPIAPDLLRLEGSTLTYLRPMVPRERVSFHMAGFGNSAADYDFHITDKTGTGVHLVGDRPMTRINVFSIDHIQAVEPFIAIDAAPGAEIRWRYTYTFTAPH
jgi:hypothetical protein